MSGMTGESSDETMGQRLRRWRPAPVIRASIWMHVLSLGALAVGPAWWPAVLGVLAANHGLLACGMHPRARMLGPNLTRLPPDQHDQVALTFDDGPDPEVTPRVLDLLDSRGVKGTFFVIGERAARHGPLLREMRRRGHVVGNHTQRHPGAFATWGPVRQWREITAAQGAIGDACGAAPRLFRPPMGLRNPLLDPVLAVEGLSLVTWTRRGYDTMVRNPDRVLTRLTRGLSGGDVLLLHDGQWRAAGTPVVLQVLPRLLDAIAAKGLRGAALPEAPPQPPGAGG